MRRLGLILAPLFLLACSSGGQNGTGGGSSSNTTSNGAAGSGGTGAGGADAGMTGDGGPIGGDRPVTVHVPPTYDPATPMPLVIMLHGYTASGALEELYLNLTAQSDKRGFLYAHPDGLKDQANQGFWNATDACCNFGGSTVDDSGYLSAVVEDIKTRFSVDAKRVYFVGHSNGGFMSHRMACDHADQIAAIASLAGAMWLDTSLCKPSEPVHVLEIHGTADATIAYDGGANAGHSYPSALTTVEDWATLDGCTLTADTSHPNLDLESVIAGNETDVRIYAEGCKAGGHSELWTIQGGSHLPALSATFTADIIDFLYAHPKP